MLESLVAGSSSTSSWFIWLVLLWTVPWKGLALWKSAKNEHKWWFIVLLVLNTMAVLEIIYIFFFSKKKEVVEKVKEHIEIKEEEYKDNE